MIRRPILYAVVVMLGVSQVSHAQIRRRVGMVSGGFATLPFNQTDQSGNQWLIYQNGMLQQQGNAPMFTQGAMLLINGENVQQTNNANRVPRDAKTGELIFECNPVNNVNITRHIEVRPEGGYVRYIDVFKNTQGQAQTLDVQLQSRINFGFVGSQSVPDPSNADKTIGWVGQTGANRAVVFVTAGRSAHSPIVLNPQPDSNLVQGDLTLSIPANAEVAVMSVYATAASADAGVQFVTTLKDADLLRDVPSNLRRELVNFNAGDQFIGEREVLRGTTEDVIELRNANGNGGNGGASDQLNGTLGESSYTLHAFYGDITLPADNVVGMISVGQYRPRQLLVTADGQVFGGTLAKNTISITLGSGQVTEVPLSQISRFGYRKRSNEADASDPNKSPAQPMVLLRSGDRIAIQMPTEPIEFLTRFGAMKLAPGAVSAITFQSDTSPVHTLQLTDGSHLSGLLQASQLNVTLAGTAPTTQTTTDTSSGTPSPNTTGTNQHVTIPVAAIARLQFKAIPDDPDDQTPTLQLASGDLLVGTISGTFKIDTAFDTLTINGPEIRSLTHARDAGSDLQIVLWDQSRISGNVSDVQLPCTLVSGTQIFVPPALIDSYNQPQPQASAEVVKQIEATAKDLSADDWKTREAAEAKLISMGPVVVTTLKALSPSQPPEAQQRIEAILRKLATKKGAAHAAGDATATPSD